MSYEIRGIPPWPQPYLPKNGLLLFYDPATDLEYQVLPEQLLNLAGLGAGATLPSLQTFRFRTRAEANLGFGGQVLDDLDYSTLFTYARVLVEFWRDDPTNLNEKPRGQELIAVYDPNADAKHMGYATSGGPAAGVSKVGLVLVFPDDPAATGVLKYDAAQRVAQGQLRYQNDGQGVEFYEALQNMVNPVPAPVRGTTTAYWKPAVKPPVPGGGAPVASLYYTIDESKNKRDNGQLPDGGRPTAAINDVWNGVGDNLVYLQVLETGRWAKYGQLLDAQGNWSFVEVDLDTATTRLAGGGEAEALHFIYTVQATDVTNPPSPVTVPVAGARGFGVVGVRKLGSQDFNPIAPGTQYTTGVEQVVVAVLTPPLAAGDEVIVYYVNGVVAGAGYTKPEADARFRPLAVPTGTGAAVTFDLERHWPPLNTGTYAVDPTGAVADVCFQLVLAPGCSEIQIPATGFVKVSTGLFNQASENTYWFCVRVDGLVQYAITQRY